MVCMSLPYISREQKTKQILFMRSKSFFLRVNFYFDVPKCIFKKKKIRSLKC